MALPNIPDIPIPQELLDDPEGFIRDWIKEKIVDPSLEGWLEKLKTFFTTTIEDMGRKVIDELWSKIQGPLMAIWNIIKGIGLFLGCIFQQIFEVSFMNFLNNFLQPELCSWFVYSFTTPCLFYWVLYVAAFLLYWLIKLPLDALQMSFILDLGYNLLQFVDEVDFTNGMFYLTKFNQDVTCKCFTTPNYKYFFCWQLSNCSLDVFDVNLSDICIPDSKSELPHWESDLSGNITENHTYDCEIPGCF